MNRQSGHVEVLVVGAGPYGLAAAAHLRAEGVRTRIFGEPMSFWRDKMPCGMLLRSPWQASHIADPGRKLTLDAFRESVAPDLAAPVPLHRFVEYGRWFAEQSVADADPRQVRRIRRVGDRFTATTADGEPLSADRVVVATGIGPHSYVPPTLHRLGGRWVSHASEHRDFSRFAGQAVAVVGGGQSALESAALMHEAGVEVTVVMRRPAVRWLSRSARLHSLGPLASVLYAPTDVGPAGLSRLVAMPRVFARVPSQLRTPLTARCIRPAGAAWLIERLADVRILVDTEIAGTQIDGQHVSLQLADDSIHVFSHIVCGTGYRVNIVDAPGPVDPDLVRQVRTARGMPVLGRGLESSVPGLHFLGAPSAFSFGPLARFVAGTDFAGDELVRGVCHRRGRRQ